MDIAYALRDDVLSRSLEDLDGEVWPEPDLHSFVTDTCFALRRKKLRDLDDTELRVGLDQQVGLGFLIPLAIERLRDDPMLEATHYPGDLLRGLLSIPADYWDENPDLRGEARSLAETARGTSDWPDLLTDAYERFWGRRPPRPWLGPKSMGGRTSAS